jgi:hypothetical protein
MNDSINDFCTNVFNAIGKKYNRESCDKIKAKFEDEDIVNIRQLVKVVNAGAMSKDEVTSIFREGFSALIAIRTVEALYYICKHPEMSAHKALVATDEGHSSARKANATPNNDEKPQKDTVKDNKKKDAQGAVDVWPKPDTIYKDGKKQQQQSQDSDSDDDGPPSNINKKDCKAFNICFDFVKGAKCKRGDKCKFIHTSDISNMRAEGEMSDKLKFCFEYKKSGTCKLGGKCQYMHVSAQELDELLVNAEKDGGPSGVGGWSAAVIGGSGSDGKTSKSATEVVTEVSWSGLTDLYGKKQGTGRQEEMNGTHNYVYEGDFVDNVKEGFGKLTAGSAYVYEGSWKGGKMEGHGKLSNFKDGSVYEGSFFGGMKDGEGVKKYHDGVSFTGVFKDDIPFSGRLLRTDGSTEFLSAGQEFSMIYKDPDAIGHKRSMHQKVPSDICYDFMNKGKCSRSPCKFSHDVGAAAARRPPKVQAKPPPGVSAVNEAMGEVVANSDLSPNAAPFMIPSAIAPESAVAASAKGGKKKNKPCYDFLKGTCRRGDACIFKHSDTRLGKGGAKPGVAVMDHESSLASATADLGSGVWEGNKGGELGLSSMYADVDSGGLGQMSLTDRFNGDAVQEVVGAELFESLVGGLLGSMN